MNNKERILRDIEYINGGITALKTLFNNEGKHAPYYQLMDEWQDIICSVIDLIEEDYENAADA